MKIGNASIEEHAAKFKMLVTKSKLEKNEAVVEYFRETLPIPLQKIHHDSQETSDHP